MSDSWTWYSSGINPDKNGAYLVLANCEHNRVDINREMSHYHIAWFDSEHGWSEQPSYNLKKQYGDSDWDKSKYKEYRKWTGYGMPPYWLPHIEWWTEIPYCTKEA